MSDDELREEAHRLRIANARPNNNWGAAYAASVRLADIQDEFERRQIPRI